MDEPTIVEVHCTQCCRSTRHAVKTVYNTEGSYTISMGDVETKANYQDSHQVLECLGCQAVRFRHTTWDDFSESESSELYPPSLHRSLPPWKTHLEYPVSVLLEEVYRALQSDSRILALMGARAILDLVALDTVGDVGTFQQKLAALENYGHIGKRQREHLDAVLDAGNAATHRAYRAKPRDLNHVMDIIENLLQTVYVLGRSSSELRKATPERKRHSDEPKTT